MEQKATKSSGKEARAARLAAALKTNLRKRKAQARERARAEGARDTGPLNAPAMGTRLAEDPPNDG
jgi:hypothetical protein